MSRKISHGGRWEIAGLAFSSRMQIRGGGGSKGLGLPAARLLLGQLNVALCLKERRWQARGRAAHFEVNGLWFREVHLQDGQPTVRKHDGCRNGRVAPPTLP